VLTDKVITIIIPYWKLFFYLSLPEHVRFVAANIVFRISTVHNTEIRTGIAWLVVTRLWPGCPWNRRSILGKDREDASPECPDRLWDQPNFLVMAIRCFFPCDKAVGGVKLITHFHPVTRFTMTEVHPHTSRDFMACTGTTWRFCYTWKSIS
jgi:hypothetical protein